MRIKRTAIRLFAVNAGLVLIFGVGGAPSEASTATPACSTMNLSLGLGTQYVARTPPMMVVLRPGARGYFLVAKYRCDIGIAMIAKTIRIYPPNTTQQLVGNATPFVDVGGFPYCKGGPKDPGQLVEVSPVRASFHSM